MRGMEKITRNKSLYILIIIIAFAWLFTGCAGDETEVNLFLGDSGIGDDDDTVDDDDDDSGGDDDDNGDDDDDDDSTQSDFEVIVEAANAYLTAELPPVMTVSDLYTNLNDGDDTNDPFILSIRSQDDYDAGHIPGAVHMNYREVPDNLGDLPATKGNPIVVYCYTGHTASQITMLLNMLGY